MNLRLKMYNILVNRIPAIQKAYHKIRLEKTGIRGRVYAWFMLFKMNIEWILGKRKLEEQVYYPDIYKSASIKCPESQTDNRESPQKLAERFFEADIISFDIFDTLIFRPVCRPSDLFFFVGEKLEFMDFERIRREMEKHARMEAYKKKGSYEVTLEEIYEEIEKWTGIPKEMGMQEEINAELECCYANPYMLQVYRLLCKKIKGTSKKIICVSDMYLSQNVLKKMLEKCGYREFTDIFVSCEYGKSKADGKLYDVISKKIGKDIKYVHIGDNQKADEKWARKKGWDSYLYKNVNIVGMPYRAEDMSVITGTLYRGIVNNRLHNGCKQYSFEYELGYIYGGIFAMGYCQFIHEYVKHHSIDKILFLSRDGDILNKTYQYLYPQEIKKCEYVYWSRNIATKLMAKYDKYDFIRRFIQHKINQNLTIEEVYHNMELEDLLPENSKEYLTDKNVEKVKRHLIEHWDEVLLHYEEMSQATKLYYQQVLYGCSKVLAVDVGWAGSGALALETLRKKEWKIECEIIGMLAGTNSLHNAEKDAAECFLYTGKLISYLYSQDKNREYWKWHNPAKNHNLLTELLLSSKEGSLKGMVLVQEESEKYRFLFKKPDVEAGKVEKIQDGILEFVKDYINYVPENFRKEHLISGSDAYAVLKILLQSEMDTKIEIGI